MTRDRKIILAIAAVMFLTAWFFRYSASAADNGAVYISDRWTGHTYRCVMATCFQTFPPIKWVDLNSN